MKRDRIFYRSGRWFVAGSVEDGYVDFETHRDDHFRIQNRRRAGKGYVTPCWWLFRRSIRTVMNKAIDKVNRLNRKDQRILFGKNTVVDALESMELEAEALKLLDEEFQT